MRLLLTLFALATLLYAPARAEPRAAPGWRVEPLPYGLGSPSGAARDGAGLVLTDLATGRVVRADADGDIQILHYGLPAGRDVLGERTGPYKVRVRDGQVFVSQGWQDADRAEVATDHAILELTPDGGVRVLSRGFWNPYDFEWGGDAWYVADAGRNALMRLAPGGALSMVFAFPDLVQRRDDLSFLSPTEFKGDEPYTLDAVPTGVALRGERVFVALFGGFPFIAGSGRIVSLPKTGGAGARLELDGLDAPVDIAFDANGRLLVLEMGRFDLANAAFRPGTGRLSRVDLASGGRKVLLEGLSRPATVVPMPGGAYVIVQSGGAILRLEASP